VAVEEWDRRQLCPDGGCTGIINSTGVCGTCGRAAPNWGDERKRGLRNPTDAPPIVKDDDDIAPSAPAALGAMADWGTRRLCSDGGCIGVIGANNKCKTCGKPGPAKAKKPADGDGELERVAAEMAGTATAGDIAAIVPAADEPDEDDDEYEDDDEDEDEDDEGDDEDDEDDVDDVDAVSTEAHDHGDENDADEASGDDDSDDASDEDDDEDDGDEDDGGDDDEDDGDEEEDDADEGDDEGAISASAASDRELCPDGACVGVIGDDGHCKVCKKPRDWKETA
jgi:hypothetical protein